MDSALIKTFFSEYGVALFELAIIWVVVAVIWGKMKKSKNKIVRGVVKEIQDVSPKFMIITIALFWIFLSGFIASFVAYIFVGIKLQGYYQSKGWG